MTTEKDRQEGQSGREHDELKVTDRRLFTRDGVLREGADEHETGSSEAGDATPVPPAEEAETDATAATAVENEPGDAAGFERRSLDEPEGVDFTILINAMAQPALIFLGEVAHPGSGKKELNLEQARLQIDLLDLLRIKCRGNLTPEEEGLLDRILYQLRMLYVSRSSQPAT